MVDWSRTRAWAEGGYYARIFINELGREPRGSVRRDHRTHERDALAARIAEIAGPEGETLAHRVETPEALYRAQNGRAPDLLVFFGDLDYRAAGTIGHGRIHLANNDTGADACNHDWDGLFVHAGPGAMQHAEPAAWSIYDVTRTILALQGVHCPEDLLGMSRSA
jgi:predicted AlkP superfamily phosphohydrolase/phosphomutase